MAILKCYFTSSFLRVTCGEDSDLRQRLDALLAAHEQPDTALPTEADNARPTLMVEFAEEPADDD